MITVGFSWPVRRSLYGFFKDPGNRPMNDTPNQQQPSCFARTKTRSLGNVVNLENFAIGVGYVWAAALSVVIVSTGALLTLPQDAAPWFSALWISIGVAWAMAFVSIVARRKLGRMPRYVTAR